MGKPHEKQLTRHHRKPRAKGGNDLPTNISMVTTKKHESYHILFGHGGDVEETARILNETWIDPEYKLVVVRK